MGNPSTSVDASLSIEALTLIEAFLRGKNSEVATTETLLRNTAYAHECKTTGLSFLYNCDYSEGQIIECYINVGGSWHEYDCDYDNPVIAAFLETLSEEVAEQLREAV